MRLSERDEEYLKALQRADKALENLWKKCEVGSNMMRECSHIQCCYIHEEIRKVRIKLDRKPSLVPQPVPETPAEVKESASEPANLHRFTISES